MNLDIRLALDNLFAAREAYEEGLPSLAGMESNAARAMKTAGLEEINEKVAILKEAVERYGNRPERQSLADIEDYPREMERHEVLIFSIGQQIDAVSKSKVDRLEYLRGEIQRIIDDVTTAVVDELEEGDDEKRPKKFPNADARKAEIAERLRNHRDYQRFRILERQDEMRYNENLNRLHSERAEAKAYHNRLEREYAYVLIKYEKQELGRRK